MASLFPVSVLEWIKPSPLRLRWRRLRQPWAPRHRHRRADGLRHDPAIAQGGEGTGNDDAVGSAAGPAAAQDAQVRIVQDAETTFALALQRAVAAVARPGIFAHAEKGEVLVPQPFEEFRGLLGRLPVERVLGVAVDTDGVIETDEHVAPVMNRMAHLLENALEP